KPELLAQASALAKGKAQNLIDYSDDQWSATVGLGHKFTNKWSATAAVGYDSGAGNPVTTLGPTEGYWSVGLGGQYSPAENYFIQAGVKYFWLGDATAQTGGTPVGDFEDNHAIGYGMKIGYRF
ncbi:MAG: transporter, partial [Acinetobacter sp.]